MITVKDSESKVTAAKRNITIKNVRIEDNVLVDEDGVIASAIAAKLPENVEEFTIKISIELLDESDFDIDRE